MKEGRTIHVRPARAAASAPDAAVQALPTGYASAGEVRALRGYARVPVVAVDGHDPSCLSGALLSLNRRMAEDASR